ncbi:hypothetical protein L596_020962 [Steinernema carpocapsae]|uniref:Uncharacterized protein n=1 Tax=Steinernema carpocapsae TaxID=34508 RepID=A0A4U5MV11_STECR|nr:hypothetical protein L596_020962 [Steinernema carpocapsae]
MVRSATRTNAMLTKGLRMMARISFAVGSGSRRQRIAPRRVFGFRVRVPESFGRVASLVVKRLNCSTVCQLGHLTLQFF